MHRSIFAAALFGLVFGAVHASAQSEDKPEKTDKPPAKQSSSDDILNDLLKDDLGLTPKKKNPDKQGETETLPDGPLDLAEEFPEGDQNPLSRVGRGMRQSQQRLERQHDAGSDTQKVQDQIISDLEELLKKKRQQQKQQQANQNKKQPQASRNDPKQQKQPGKGQRSENKNPAAESNAEASKGTVEKVEQPLPFGMAADVWGHLKERERQILIQAARMQYLDEYNQMIKDYFSTLAKSRR